MILLNNEPRPLKDYDSVSLAAKIRDHFVRNYPAHDVERVTDAIQVASYLHRHDVRRGGRGKLPNPPYIEHPLRVAIRMYSYFGVGDPDWIIAAILHDTVEDHPFEFSEFQGAHPRVESEQEARGYALNFIGQRFGYRAASIVEDVSNPVLSIPVGVDKAERNRLKMEQYHSHVVPVIKRSDAALVLKLSDFVDNAGSLHHHYALGERGVEYFLNRYEPLIPIYREALLSYQSSHENFSTRTALGRLRQVEEQFEKFRAGLDTTAAA